MGRGWGARRRALLALLLCLLGGVIGLAAVALGESGGTRVAAFRPPVALHPVAGSFRPDRTTLASCSDTACFEQAYGNVAFRDGPKVALDLFDEHFGDGSDPACHRIAHAIGSASLARNGNNVARTFAEGSATCWSGYYHGVLERALVGVKRHEQPLAKTARRLCEDEGVRAVQWTAYQCLHGLGHGLMIATGLDLPLALEVCNRLAREWDQESCKGGVFMENMSSSYGFESRWLRADDPVYPCNWVGPDDKHTCYQLVTSRVLRVVGVDWEEVARVCAEVEARWVSACFQSFGRDVSGQTHRDPEKIGETCALARPYGGETDCISFAAMDMTANFTSGTQAAELCSATEAASVRRACFHAIGTIMGRWRTNDEQRAHDCRALSPLSRDVTSCLRGSSGRPLPAGIAR